MLNPNLNRPQSLVSYIGKVSQLIPKRQEFREFELDAQARCLLFVYTLRLRIIMNNGLIL